MNAKEVLEYAKKNNVKIVDLRFTDWPGQWQHCSYPISIAIGCQSDERLSLADP